MIPKLYISRTPDGVDFPLPTYASKHHVGLELLAAIPTVLKLEPSERVYIPIGFCIGIPQGFCGQIVSLPDVAKETGLVVLSSPQIVNPADRDALFILIQNSSRGQLILRRGQPIAQLVITTAVQVCWEELQLEGAGDQTSSKSIQFEQQEVQSIENTEEKPSGRRVVKSIRERGKAADEIV